MPSSALHATSSETRPPGARTYGYIRASALKEVESPEEQARIIETYCQGTGRHPDELFVDDALSFTLPLAKREAGKRLMLALREGDHVVVARLDLLCRSFIEFGRILEGWAKLGVVVHLLDVPAVPLDPENTLFRRLIDLLVLFNDSRTRMVATRSKTVAYDLKAESKRTSRFAPYGFKWENRGRFTYMVTNPNEQQICIEAAQMKLDGYSWHQIRQHFAYAWRVRNRQGNQFGYEEVRKLTFRGFELLHEAGRLDATVSIVPG